MATEKIMFDDPKAATFRTNIEGWVSRNGWFYGKGPNAEDAARRDGCDMKRCATCETMIPKQHIYCDACNARRTEKQFAAMPEAQWDGEGMIYSEAFDEYYPDLESAGDDAEDRGISFLEMMLVICDPVYLSEISEDTFYEQLPDDGELPQEISTLVAEFNAATKAYGPTSYFPGKYRMKL